MSWSIKSSISALLSREEGACLKEWGGKASVALLYPNSYRVGMGNLAVHSIYRRLNSCRGIVCERAFMPGPSEMKQHLSGGTPILSIETQRPLADFDIIALTCSFENDYLNIIPMLTISRIPHLRERRGESHPVIIAGGAAPTLNPLPLLRIADAVLTGEFEAFAEEVLPAIEAGLSNRETSEALAKIEGVISGAPKAGLKRRHASDLDLFKTETVIYSKGAEFSQMHLIEVERGCPRGCRFCATPVIYGPPRRRSAGAVMAMVEDGILRRNRMGLIGADILTHPGFEEIAGAILARGASFSPSSIRVDAIDEAKARLLHKAGHRSLALGIEAGSERLRRSLGKRISDERILEAAETLAREGITRLKLYFMTGLPGESDADTAAIASLSKMIRDRVRSAAGRTSRTTAVDVTVAPFVPKPHTPFASSAFEGEEKIKLRVKSLRRALGAEPGMTVRADSAIEASIESLIASGGEEITEFLEKAHRLGSARAAMRSD